MVYASVVRVGGSQRPAADLRIEGEDGVLKGCVIETDEPRLTAKKLGMRLYDTVGLRGRATWDSAALKISAFVILEVIDFHEASISIAFAELAQASGDTWDDIDAAAFVDELRGRR